MNYAIMPYLGCHDLTQQALLDVLQQTLPTTVLLINQGGEPLPGLQTLHPRVRSWNHTPPFPSLARTWNVALDYAWATGAEHAWVVNNDIRVHPETYGRLLEVQRQTGAWFVSATGVQPEQFAYFCRQAETDPTIWPQLLAGRGGPDFSCFLITRECHGLYRFDEGFVPAYLEDLDMHRRLMLDGWRDKIFGVNIPFEHVGSATINQTPQMAERYGQLIERGSRQHYLRKWGGPANQERYRIPFSGVEEDGVTTPELQHGIHANG